MDKLLLVLAITSLIVSILPNLANLAKIVLYFTGPAYNGTNGLTVGYGFFVWLSLSVWPIVYFFVR